MKRVLPILLILITFLTLLPPVQAGQTMSLSGYLRDTEGQLIDQGIFEFKLSLWNGRDADNTNTLKAEWNEEHPVIVSASNSGYFEINIGSVTEIPDQLISQFPFLQVEIKDLEAGTPFELLDPQPNNDIVDRLDFIADTIFFSDNTFTIRQSNQLSSEVSLQFGQTLAATIKFDSVADAFNISKPLTVQGGLTVNGLINGRDVVADGLVLDQFNTVEKIIAAINASEHKINAENILFTANADEYNQYHQYDLATAESFVYDESDQGDLIEIKDGMLGIKEDDWISVFASNTEGDPFAKQSYGLDYSPADGLLYITSQGAHRVYAVDPETKEMVHQIGMSIRGGGGVLYLNDLDVSDDGLTLAVASAGHYVSVWKRASIQDEWAFAFDLGTPGLHGNESDGTKLYSPNAVAIRNSDGHIFVGTYYGLTKDFNSNGNGYGGVIEYDGDGNFVEIPLHYGKNQSDGYLSSGEAMYVYDIQFDKDENLWVSSARNQVARFNSQTWDLQRTIMSTGSSDGVVSVPVRIVPAGENHDQLITHNDRLQGLQRWHEDGRILNVFGHKAENTFGQYDQVLSLSILGGLAADDQQNIYVADRSNNNIQKINFDAIDKPSRVIFPTFDITDKYPKKLLVSKMAEGAFNHIHFQYRFGDSEEWTPVPEDLDLSDIAKSSNEFHLAAVFTPTLSDANAYTSDLINGVILEYSLIP